MRTVTFKSVLWGAARLLGMNPEKDLTPADAARVTEYIQERYNEGLAFIFWPELTIVEERTPDANKVVLYEEAGKTAIGETAQVTERHPLRVLNPGPMAWVPMDTGLQLEATAPATVYAQFRVRPNVWDSTKWTAGTYSAGTVRYYDVNGECYLSLVNGNNVTPGSDATKWRKLDFPFVLSGFVKKAAAADGLGDLKQTARKNALLQQAYVDLANSSEQATSQQGQYDRVEVRSYGSY